MTRFVLRGPLALLAVIGLITGCPAADRDSSATPRDPDSASAVTRGLSIAATAVCDTVATQWSQASVPVTRSDGDTQVNSSTAPVSACVVTAMTEDRDSALARRGSYWTDSTRHGWRGITRWDADGPDGSSRTLIRSGVRCQVDGEWDGGDDSNPAAARSKSITERTTCWLDTARLTPRDTSTTP